MRVIQGLLAIMSLQRATEASSVENIPPVTDNLSTDGDTGSSTNWPISNMSCQWSELYEMDATELIDKIIINTSQLEQINTPVRAVSNLENCDMEVKTYIINNTAVLKIPDVLMMFFEHSLFIYSKGKTPAEKLHKHSCDKSGSVFDVKRNSAFGRLLSSGDNDRISDTLNELNSTKAKQVKLPDLIIYKNSQRRLVKCLDKKDLKKPKEENCDGNFKESIYDGNCIEDRVSADKHFELIFPDEVHRGEKGSNIGALSIYFVPISKEMIQNALSPKLLTEIEVKP